MAEIHEPAAVELPPLPVSSYVVEMEVLFRDSKGRLDIVSGEPDADVKLSLGSVWPKDLEQKKIPCRLFRSQPFGFNWLGEQYFEVGQPLALRLVVCNGQSALLRNGERILGSTISPAYLHLRIEAADNIDCTIRSLSVRELSVADLSKLGWKMPDYKFKPDPASVTTLKGRMAKQRAKCPDKPAEGKPLLVKTTGSLMCWIAPGTFTMGNPEASDTAGGKGKQPVRITKGYWIGQYKTTQAEWLAVMKQNPSRFQGSPYLPVHWISWDDAVEFCRKLNEQETAAGRVPAGYEYRLPTEAEWEFACRAGTAGEFALPPGQFWRPGPGGRGPILIGQFPPNTWGLYDMQGNVPEWCMDAWADYPTDGPMLTDRYIPARANSDKFVLRGGGWWSYDDNSTSSTARWRGRSVACEDRGMRLLLGPVLPKLK